MKQLIKDEYKQLPHSFNSEKSLIGIILEEPTSISYISEGIKPGDFYGSATRQIYSAMRGLFYKDLEIDVVSLENYLDNQLEESTVAKNTLMEILQHRVVGKNIDYLIQDIRNKSLLRKLAITVEQHKDKIYQKDAEFQELFREFETSFITLGEKVKDNKPTDPKGILEEVNQDIAKAEQQGWHGFQTGFSNLDSRTGGFMLGHVVILGGYTGQGKTFTSLQLMLNLLRGGAKVMMFSSEMDRKMLLVRMLANLMEMNPLDILKGGLDKEIQERKQEAEKEIEKFQDRLFIYDFVYWVEDIRLKVRKAKLQHGVDIVFIDFIQNLKIKGGGSIYEQMSRVSLEIQRIAQEFNVCIVIVSQVSQSSAGDMNKYGAISYKGAGEIAAIADVGLWLKTSKDLPDGHRYLIIRKARHGIPGKFIISLEYPSGRVVEVFENESQKKKEISTNQLEDGTDGITF